MLSVKPWRTEAVMFFILMQFTCFFVGALAFALLHKFGVNGFKKEDDFGSIVVAACAFQGATWILIPLFFRFHNIRLKEGLGFDKKWVRSLLLAFGVMIVISPIAYLLEAGSAVLMKKIGWSPQEETAVTAVTNASTLPTEIFLAFFAIILAPVAEEFIFRGVLFPFVKQLGFPKTAWIGVSLLFALIHGNVAAFIPLFVLALTFTWLYETTDCLLAPIFAHALFNAAGFILVKFVP
jgi:membrane protease YdiL (CAAX protease family)